MLHSQYPLLQFLQQNVFKTREWGCLQGVCWCWWSYWSGVKSGTGVVAAAGPDARVQHCWSSFSTVSLVLRSTRRLTTVGLCTLTFLINQSTSFLVPSIVETFVHSKKQTNKSFNSWHLWISLYKLKSWTCIPRCSFSLLELQKSFLHLPRHPVPYNFQFVFACIIRVVVLAHK